MAVGMSWNEPRVGRRTTVLAVVRAGAGRVTYRQARDA